MTLLFFILVFVVIIPFLFGKSGKNVSLGWHLLVSIFKSALFIAMVFTSIYFFGIGKEKTNPTESTMYVNDFMLGVEGGKEYAYYVDTTNTFHKVLTNECDIVYDTVGESYATTITADATLTKYGRLFVKPDSKLLRSYYKETTFHIHKSVSSVVYDTIYRTDTVYVSELNDSIQK